MDNQQSPIATPLQEWATANDPDKKFYAAGGYWDQIIWVRDNLTWLIGSGLDFEDARGIATVIADHTSKSVRLPVYALSRPDLGLTIYLRDNFHGWKMSVVSAAPIAADFTGLFRTTGPIDPKYTGNELAAVYFEGFPPSLVFGYYEETDRCKWSAAIGGREELWATLFLLMRSIGAVKPRRWHTPESHRAELDAQTARRKARELVNG